MHFFELREKLKRLLACATVLLPYLVGVATLSIGVTEKNGAGQVFRRADYVSWSTLLSTIPTYIFGDTHGGRATCGRRVSPRLGELA